MPKVKEIDVDNIRRVLEENIEYLTKAKNRFFIKMNGRIVGKNPFIKIKENL
jgi:hypothetical protein